MVKRKINIDDHMGEIFARLRKGVLVTTSYAGKINTMTISWGALGIDWGVPVFTTYVRESRFTHMMLTENPEFTVNIPLSDDVGKILGFCGTKSGRDHDKIAELGLTPVTPEVISVPGLKEFPLTLECRVVYRQNQDMDSIPSRFVDKFYPDVRSGEGADAKDIHTAFYGEIVAAYIIED